VSIGEHKNASPAREEGGQNVTPILTCTAVYIAAPAADCY